MTPIRLVAGVVGAAALAVVVVVDPLDGPTVVTVTAWHGVDAGDLFVAAAIAVAVRAVARGLGDDRLLRVPDVPSWATLLVGMTLLALAALDASGVARRGDALAWSSVAALFAVAAVAAHVLRRRPAPARHRPSEVVGALAALLVGSAVDWLLLPSGTPVGAAALAGTVAAGRGEGRPRWQWAGAGVAASAVAVIAVADVAGLDTALALRGGGITRTAALGAALTAGAAVDVTAGGAG